MRNMNKVNTTEFPQYTSHVTMARYNVHVQDCSLRVTPLPHVRDTIPCVAFHAIKVQRRETYVFSGALGTSCGKYEHVHSESVNF